MTDMLLLKRRREFLTKSVVMGMAGLGAASWSNPLLAKTGLLLPQYYANAQEAQDFWARPRTLNLFRPATGEHYKLCYWRDGQLDVQGYRQACHLLRDVSTNKTVSIDLRLLNLLRAQKGWLESALGYFDPYYVTSGYRSPKTNEMTEGAARNSEHLKGRAVDGKYPGLPIEYQGRLIAALQAGAVGFYINKKKFIHSDIGRVRYWVK